MKAFTIAVALVVSVGTTADAKGPPVVAGLLTEPLCATAGLPKREETFDPRIGGVVRPAPNQVRAVAATADAKDPAAPPPDMAPVTAAVLSAVEKGAVPGAVVHVSQAGRLLLFQGIGQADGDRPMATDAIFRIASMTKPITSVAVMMLVEEGKIGLDDPLSRHLPEFADLRVAGNARGELVAPRRPVTIRDLLSHTSGIPYGFAAPEALKDHVREAELADGLNPRDPTLADNTRRLARIPLAHQPGTAFTYGMNTDVLGRVVEVASGQPLDRFLSERIFVPLKMTDTAFSVPGEKKLRVAAIYHPVADARPARVARVKSDPETVGDVTFSARRVLTPPKYFSGGAGLVSTAADYSRFLTMLLRGGELDGKRLLRTETIRTMTINQIGTLNCPFSIHGDKFGFGFGLTTAAGAGASVGSYSWGGIYHTFFWVDPQRELVAIIMTQLYPWGDSTLWADFQKSVYAAVGGPAETSRKTSSLGADVPNVARPALSGRGTASATSDTTDILRLAAIALERERPIGSSLSLWERVRVRATSLGASALTPADPAEPAPIADETPSDPPLLRKGGPGGVKPEPATPDRQVPAQPLWPVSGTAAKSGGPSHSRRPKVSRAQGTVSRSERSPDSCATADDATPAQPLWPVSGPSHSRRPTVSRAQGTVSRSERSPDSCATADDATPAKPTAPAISVTEETLFGDMDCLVISTPAAKYYYGKRGAGFARILDPDGHDWISYRHGGQAAGEYRGLPKSGQPVKYFHCGYGFGQYANTNPFRTSFTQVGPEQVRVESETQDGSAASVWDFYPGHATFTLNRIPGGRYWFLYEGTPGGRLDVTEDFSIRAGGKKAPLSEPWTETVPWAAFGASESPYALLCVNHQPNSPIDSYVRWPYAPDGAGHENQMTVFGFGRPGWQSPDQHTPQLTGLPARFTITLVKADKAESLAAQLIKSAASDSKVPRPAPSGRGTALADNGETSSDPPPLRKGGQGGSSRNRHPSSQLSRSSRVSRRSSTARRSGNGTAIRNSGASSRERSSARRPPTNSRPTARTPSSFIAAGNSPISSCGFATRSPDSTRACSIGRSIAGSFTSTACKPISKPAGMPIPPARATASRECSSKKTAGCSWRSAAKR